MTDLDTMINLDKDLNDGTKRRQRINLSSSPKSSRQNSPSEDHSSDYKTSNPEPITMRSSFVEVTKTRSRHDAINMLTTVDRERGRRMFGFLQGTLKAAKKENDIISQSAKEIRRKEILKKIEDRETEEKERMKIERIENAKNRRENYTANIIESRKSQMTSEFESWKSNMLKMIGHLMTSKEPRIFYKPKKPNANSKRRLEQTESSLMDMIYHREQKLRTDIEEMKRRMTERFEKNQNRQNGTEKKASSQESSQESDDDDLFKSKIEIPRKRRKTSGESSSDSSSDASDASDSETDADKTNGGLSSTITKPHDA